MRRQYGHSCGSLMPPLVGGGIRSGVNCDDDVDDDEDVDEADTTALCGPVWGRDREKLVKFIFKSFLNK